MQSRRKQARKKPPHLKEQAHDQQWYKREANAVTSHLTVGSEKRPAYFLTVMLPFVTLKALLLKAEQEI